MPIQLLDQNTINQIAAGEVVERPASVVKELMENAIDAGATAVTAEIRDGGIGFVRITDNGCGIPGDELPLAFLRHSTSKIRSAADLVAISSLGFRGEALSSIAAVSQVEVITKTAGSLNGFRYQIEGGKEKSLEEIGAPDGTTFISRNLFYNTPARRKFLKTAATEGGHVADLVEKIALSHPEISIRLIVNNQTKLHTSGNHNLKDIIYTVYGREIAANLIPIDVKTDWFTISGFIGKPVIARGNRNFENYFINGRYIKSGIIAKAIEDGYKSYMMQHKYPFTLLHFQVEPEFIDVNVHPSKMELRFKDGEFIYRTICQAVSEALSGRELIPAAELSGNREEKQETDGTPNTPGTGAAAKPQRGPEPFERRRLNAMGVGESPASYGKAAERAFRPETTAERAVRQETEAGGGVPEKAPVRADGGTGSLDAKQEPRPALPGPSAGQPVSRPLDSTPEAAADTRIPSTPEAATDTRTPRTPASAVPQKPSVAPQPLVPAPSKPSEPAKPSTPPQAKEAPGEPLVQLEMFDDRLLSEQSRYWHRLIGQVFDTYWIIEYKDAMYIIDQHAAHEKVLFEKTFASLKSREFTSQNISPPIILTLSLQEAELLRRYQREFETIGFEIEHFGGNEYAVRAVPDNLFSLAKKELLLEMLDGLSEDTGISGSEMIYDRIATMSCKAAVKGNNRLSEREANELIDQLLKLENPYACPHGRPTIISISKYEMEKKFKRIV